MGKTPRIMEDGIQREIDTTIRRIEPLLRRSEADFRPVVLMLCGIAGKLFAQVSWKRLTQPSRVREVYDSKGRCG